VWTKLGSAPNKLLVKAPLYELHRKHTLNLYIDNLGTQEAAMIPRIDTVVALPKTGSSCSSGYLEPTILHTICKQLEISITYCTTCLNIASSLVFTGLIVYAWLSPHTSSRLGYYWPTIALLSRWINLTKRCRLEFALLSIIGTSLVGKSGEGQTARGSSSSAHGTKGMPQWFGDKHRLQHILVSGNHG
jgi:hypothetical protein